MVELGKAKRAPRKYLQGIHIIHKTLNCVLFLALFERRLKNVPNYIEYLNMTLRSRYLNGMRCFRCRSCRRIRGTALKHLHLVKFSPQNCWPSAMQLNFSLVFMVFHLPRKEVGCINTSILLKDVILVRK